MGCHFEEGLASTCGKSAGRGTVDVVLSSYVRHSKLAEQTSIPYNPNGDDEPGARR